ncbi:MAG: ParA family protein [Pseudomonadota bacterium]
MQLLAVTSQKGGVGKTTLAVNLAVAASLDGVATILFDLDPQGSAAEYYARRVDYEHDEYPKIEASTPGQLVGKIRAAKEQGYGLVVIDTPPNVALENKHISQAGDFILIPVQPSILDLTAVQATIDIVKESGRPGAVVLNECKPFGDMVEQARTVVTGELEFPVLDQTIGDRMAFKHAANEGQGVMEFEPRSKASEEITALWNWVKVALNEATTGENTRKEAAHG